MAACCNLGDLVCHTFSFSAEFMADMVVSGSKSKLAIASKHFFRCGCTARGFLVWLRICSSSSLDRKKNLHRPSRAFGHSSCQRCFDCKCCTTLHCKGKHCRQALHSRYNSCGSSCWAPLCRRSQSCGTFSSCCRHHLHPPRKRQSLGLQVVCQALLHTVQQLVALHKLVEQLLTATDLNANEHTANKLSVRYTFTKTSFSAKTR